MMEAYGANPWFWLLASVGVLLTGISKSGFGGGAGVVAVPLLALIMPIPLAAALMLPVLLVMDAKTVTYYWRHADLASLRALLPAALIGVALGWWCLGQFSDTLLQLVLAGLCLVFGARPLSSYLSGLRGSAWLWGAMAGTTSTLIHAGGPPLNIYLLGRALPKLQWLATAAVFFALINLTKVVPYGLLGQWQWDTLILSTLLIPLALVGVWLGKISQSRISDAGFRELCRILLILSGLMLLIKALSSA